MKDFAIIGLGSFGMCMLESLIKRQMRVIAIDCDDEKIQQVRDLATKSIKANAIDIELLKEFFPEPVKCAIVDMGNMMERSILITNLLHKLGVQHIVVEAVNAEHGEILTIVGATQVIFPEREAAERVAGILSGRGSLDFFAVAEDFSLIETSIPAAWAGQSLVKLDLRKKKEINIVAVRKPTADDEKEHWRFPSPETTFNPDDIVLLAGKPKDLEKATT